MWYPSWVDNTVCIVSVADDTLQLNIFTSNNDGNKCNKLLMNPPRYTDFYVLSKKKYIKLTLCCISSIYVTF